MFIAQDVIENIRESNDIVDVISEYVSLQRKGKNYVGLCPFHKEKTPSFNVQQDKQIYHCFGCGEGGNVITFIMKYRNLGFTESIKLLAERANIIIPTENSGESKINVEFKEKIYNINREAALFFYNALQKNSSPVNYLKKRGITPDIIKRFGLGFSLNSWDSLCSHLLSKGYSKELIESAGLIIRKSESSYYDRFRNRVMFPVFDIKNRIIGFGGRVLDDSKPKYLNSPETPVFSKGRNLYGLNLVKADREKRQIVIVEGYMDVIALHQYGINNAVASLGTALTREQSRLLKRYCDEVIISYDSDTAGQAAALRGLDILSDAGCSVKILSVPKGKDPDEYIRIEGKEAFENCIENAVPLIEYKIRRKIEGFDIKSTEGKIGFIKACAQILVEIGDPVVIDAYISKLSSETGISPSALYEEITLQRKIGSISQDGSEKHISGESRYNNNIDGQKLYLEPAYVKAEKFILRILCENSSLFANIESRLKCSDFSDNCYSKAANLIYGKLKKNEQIVPASIVSAFTNADDMRRVGEIFNTRFDIDSESINNIVNDYIALIHKNRLLNSKNELLSKIKEYEKAGNNEGISLLLKNVIEIERQMRLL